MQYWLLGYVDQGRIRVGRSRRRHAAYSVLLEFVNDSRDGRGVLFSLKKASARRCSRLFLASRFEVCDIDRQIGEICDDDDPSRRYLHGDCLCQHHHCEALAEP